MIWDKSSLRAEILRIGAVAVGFARAETPASGLINEFDRWLEQGNHAGMEWLERHRDLRSHPRNVLPEVKTIVSIAFPYYQPQQRPPSLPAIAMYAYGQDYHEALRARLRPLCRRLEADTGATTRICVDSAPLPERYWAMKAGIGRLGDNGTIIIDGYGSFVFLCEILTSLELPPDVPSRARCHHCGQCRKACPGGALLPDGTLRASRCLSYLTIEAQPEEWIEEGEGRTVVTTPAGQNTLYGCDICQLVCPYNSQIDSSLTLPEFLPAETVANRPGILTLTDAQAKEMSPDDWKKFTSGTPMYRARKRLPVSAHRLNSKPNTNK